MGPLAAGVLAAGALGGGYLGSRSPDIEYSPGQIAAGRLMRQIGRTELDYTAPQGITREALAGAGDVNMDISPALAYTQKVLSGGFMDGNPYLDRTFDRASSRVRQGLDTQFAQAGRYGSDAHQNVMADQYNDLATSIYGGAYDRERGYMDRAAVMLPTLYGQDINNLQGLLSIGATENALADQEVNWDVYEPYKRLQMMQAGQGLMPQTYYQNTGAGALGGALAGLELGAGIMDGFGGGEGG